jgi:Na+/H+ antiporter NhaD/arsenite permease-like protein
MALLQAEFVIFAIVLLGVAVLHRHALAVALVGLAAVSTYYLVFSDAPGVTSLLTHFSPEWVILANLLLLLLGFAVLANQFERSNVPDGMPTLLPNGWVGGLALLGLVFGLSIFLDNIAGAIIGGVVAQHVYRNQVCVGFQASIVAAANAGGAGSVIGDTTTTMMWISGVSPLTVLPAFIGAGAAFAVFGILGAKQQHRFRPIVRDAPTNLRIDRARVGIVVFLLFALFAVNVVVNGAFPGLEEEIPALGLGLWAAIVLSAPVRQPEWRVIGNALNGAIFLVALVGVASFMPVERLPPPSYESIFVLGWLSAVFDNIPLTALAINQGGYDWALLAYAVGFGGSMVWFGSSAGVALTNLFPEGRSVVKWLREGWYIPLAYLAGFAAMLLVNESF